MILILLLVYYCVMKEFFYNLEESDISESDRKLVHWVSPHMHQEARNIKTSIEKIDEEKRIHMSRSKIESKHSEDNVPGSYKKVESKMQV